MNNYAKLSAKIIFSCLSIAIIGCSTQKDNATNRSLQNLSARYNYIYNSNVLLTTYQDDLSQTYKDNYDNFLAVYIAPETSDYLNISTTPSNVKSLDEITQKAQTIISEKNFSNYIDEAYILLGKTNFYKGNYFTAVEYFDYTAKTYRSNKNVFLSAMTWKARSLMQLNNYEKAELTLDTVKATLDSVKSEKAEPLATLAQMNIYQQDYKGATSYLEQAIKETNKIQSRTRWPYILAQLYEYNKEYDASLRNYTKVENSNAPFEMYFNAKLSKIRINDILNSQTSNRKQQLLKLLKDDKNFDYTDQIYYEVAEDYFSDKEYKKAEEYYKLSAQKSITNQYQKGLSYLKLADLNFKNLSNYVNAKLYYDSAVTTLPKNYQGYEGILKKAENLEYLTKRYQLIADEDTLQFIAHLPEQAREKKLNELFEPKKEVNNTTKTIDNGKVVKFDDPTKTQNSDKFYFSNTNAISRGFTDFKKRWGNRSLEDNWRQSVKSSAQVNQQNQSAIIDNSNNSTNMLAANADKESRIKEYTALLPLTADQMVKSDQKIIDAYFEIAGFYQQVLQDEEEAAKVYEELLSRYPQNNHLEAVYYSLYLVYAKTDQAKSDLYKNKVLAIYPNSVYAKTIVDPNFSAKQNALDLEINKIYNTIFDRYEQKDFPTVIAAVNETNQRFPGNSLQAQYDYLKAIAIGRTQNVDSLLIAFNTIITKYPDDKLINPLVLDHINYIQANLPAFKARKIALIDFDPTEPRFISQRENTVVVVNKPETTLTKPEPEVIKPITPVTTPVAITTPSVPVNTKSQEIKNEPTVKPVDNLFSKAESNIYYYVVSVNDMSLSVSSSRFGIGQFNRGNYAGTALKHQLLELDEDQLIFVGTFASLDEVKTYAESITPQLTKIMKVPATTYKGFYISKENFDKIKNRELLNRYIEFFKNNQ
ncbi:type IX secretion system periplasmic lipoprotein PorW/SprE [Pedobacter boryungensis]|uniref:Gliding motility protein n=1 Tax=Pedobacter boryungensis TaxID=869962 RepID=A0ABX2DD12_9SPHI|nr:gliding motility protein [Pedobacter boryungensis]NQX31982.1 gliding motility protein [Pedobacter boryungensis]